MPILLQQLEQTLRHGLPSCDLQSGGLLRQLLAEFVSTVPTAETKHNMPIPEGTRQVNQAIRWLTLQFSQPISIEHMARSLGYHRTHLSKLFKEHTGMSPMEFLDKIRLERAKLLLLEPLKIEQVASSVGYADPLYFSRKFRKMTGQSPTEFRCTATRKPRFDCMQD